MSDNELGRKVQSMSVSEIMENLTLDASVSPREHVLKALARQERSSPGWRFRLQPELDSSGLHAVTAQKDLVKIELLFRVDERAGALVAQAELFFLEYPIQVSPLKKLTRLPDIFTRRCDELAAWLRAQATSYTS